jgi:hypothetical protein
MGEKPWPASYTKTACGSQPMITELRSIDRPLAGVEQAFRHLELAKTP